MPGLLLYVSGLSLAPELYLKWELAWIGPAIVVHALAISLVVSLLTLAVSSLSRSARVAGLGLFGLIAGLEMVRLILQQGFRQKYAMLLSVQTDLRAIGDALFGLTDRDVAVAWGWAAARAGAPVARAASRSCARACGRWRSSRERDHGGQRRDLEFTRASRWYGPVIALNDVTTQVPPGVTGLLGPERRRQVDVPEARRRAARAEPGRGEAARPAPPGARPRSSIAWACAPRPTRSGRT